MNETMSFEEKVVALQDEIMNQDDVNVLYEIQIELNQDISNMHVQIGRAETQEDKTIQTGRMKIYYSLLEVCTNRIDDLRKIQVRLNHNFRMMAKRLLEKPLYEKIMMEARKPHIKRERRGSAKQS